MVSTCRWVVIVDSSLGVTLIFLILYFILLLIFYNILNVACLSRTIMYGKFCPNCSVYYAIPIKAHPERSEPSMYFVIEHNPLTSLGQERLTILKNEHFRLIKSFA